MIERVDWIDVYDIYITVSSHSSGYSSELIARCVWCLDVYINTDLEL